MLSQSAVVRNAEYEKHRTQVSVVVVSGMPRIGLVIDVVSYIDDQANPPTMGTTKDMSQPMPKVSIEHVRAGS